MSTQFPVPAPEKPPAIAGCIGCGLMLVAVVLTLGGILTPIPGDELIGIIAIVVLLVQGAKYFGVVPPKQEFPSGVAPPDFSQRYSQTPPPDPPNWLPPPPSQRRPYAAPTNDQERVTAAQAQWQQQAAAAQTQWKQQAAAAVERQRQHVAAARSQWERRRQSSASPASGAETSGTRPPVIVDVVPEPVVEKFSPEDEYYGQRYSLQWSKISRAARELTLHRCSLDPAHPAEVVHHARYKDRKGSIKDREVPGLDVFPLCRHCHDNVAHNRANWIVDPHDPLLGNRNTPEFTKILIHSFRERRT